MHLEVLVEDQSGAIALKAVLEKILGPEGNTHTWRIHSYKGIGRLPPDLGRSPDPLKRIILENLPRLLKGYGKTFQHVPETTVVVVVDADDRDCRNLKRELLNVLRHCKPAPRTLLRIAIEEGEAWLLGDIEAIKRAYPRAKERVLHSYVQDSICGTWETLADAIFPGGSAALKKLGYPQIGIVKCEWAEKITPHVHVERNRSKSFQVFRNGLLKLASLTQDAH